MPNLELLHIPYSPWSEKARWALAARGIDYKSRYYQPLIGEPALRLRLKRARGNVSVPVLFTPEGPLADSLAIALYAGTRGSGPDLFPASSDVERWNTFSERGLDAGRALSLTRVLADDAALKEMVPKPLAKALGGVAVRIARFGVKRTLRKYGAPTVDVARADLRALLGELRAALGGAAHLYPGHGLTYADIAAAQVLAFVTPPTKGLRIGKANRSAFTDAELAAEFGDLLSWRDALYATHRG